MSPCSLISGFCTAAFRVTSACLLLTQYHHSFTAVDPSLGPLILSVCLEEEENRLRVILRSDLSLSLSSVSLSPPDALSPSLIFGPSFSLFRMNECSLHATFSVFHFQNFPTAVELAKVLKVLIHLCDKCICDYNKVSES